MKSNKCLLAALAATLALGSCTDFINGFDEKAHEYQENFVKQFGEIDPNQDWSMATKVSANIDLSNAPKGTYLVKAYSKNPMSGGVLLRQEMMTGSGSISFDVVKGSDKVFLRANRIDAPGLYAFNGYYDIKNGVINTKRATRGASTKDDCQTTVGEQYTDLGTFRAERPDLKAAQGSKETNIQWYENLTQGKLYYYETGDGQFYEFTAGANNSTEGGKYCDWDGLQREQWATNPSAEYVVFDNSQGYSDWQGNYFSTPYGHPSNYIPAHYELTTKDWNYDGNDGLYPAGFYKLNDVFSEPGIEETCLFDDILPIVSPAFPETYFTEGVDNRALYADKLIPNVEYELAANGPITFTHIYGGTDYDNELGYFYWFETDDMTPAQKKAARDNAPRYVFMEHTAPQNNIVCNYNEDATVVGANEATSGKMFPKWVETKDAYDLHLGHVLRGTKYHLAYFGENYNAAKGDYTFPATNSSGAKMHVAFFMFAGHHIDLKTPCRGRGLRYSIQDMNYDTNHIWSNTGSSSMDNSKGDVYAVTYSYKGTVVVGFEDDTDMDQNDILYFVSAPIVPPSEVTEETEENQASWVIACEDLGAGADDYDFNDVVFGLTQVDSRYTTKIDGQIAATGIDKSELYFAPLAAGGTVPAYVYFDGKLIGEIHDLLIKGASTDEPINVGTGKNAVMNKDLRIKLCDLDLAKITAEADEYNSYIAAQLAKVEIKVEGKSAVRTLSHTNGNEEAPQMLILPFGWDWPAEYKTIDEFVYPEFKQWVGDSYTDWYLHKKADAVEGTDYIRNPFKTFTYE